jgi:hypothetical protein
MSQMLVGIDVSMRSNHVLFMGESGESLASFSISNDRIGEFWFYLYLFSEHSNKLLVDMGSKKLYGKEGC